MSVDPASSASTFPLINPVTCWPLFGYYTFVPCIQGWAAWFVVYTNVYTTLRRSFSLYFRRIFIYKENTSGS